MDATTTPALLLPLSPGPAGINQTLKIMVKLAQQGRKNPDVRQTAASLLQSVPEKDWRGEIECLFNFVRDQIRYVRDIRTVETVHPAEQILSQGYGDCDDKCILLASLLESTGHPCRFIALGFAPGELTHVIADTRCGRYRDGQQRWIPLDATMPHDAGWYPPGIKARMGPLYV